MQQQSCSIRISYSYAEKMLRLLRKHKIVDNSLEFIREEDSLIIPTILDKEDLQSFLNKNKLDFEYKLEIHSFSLKDQKPNNLYQAVKESIPSELHEFIPKSYDIIGDIVVVDIQQEIIDYKKEIGDALLNLFPSIQTVYRKASAVAGKLRIRELELLAGEENCITTHNEHGLRIVVDVCNTYFSPRLGHEHQRIANLVKDNDIVVDLFTGVGPFPLHIAKNKESQIYAIDINKEALKCLKQSIKQNKVIGEILPINEDIRIAAKSLPKADRVIMNLPSKSHEFINVACEIIKPKGILYFYHFVPDENAEETITEILRKELKKCSWQINRKINFHKVRESAPREIHACLEVAIHPSST